LVVSSAAATGDLLGACRVLFGAGVRLDQEFLAKLDLALVRQRFRKRATEVHPDRAAVLGRHPAVLAEFKQVEAAYRTLREHLAVGVRTAATPQAAPSAAPPTARPAQPACSRSHFATGHASSSGRPGVGVSGADHFWTAPIPARTLRLGEFLYYSGRIPWSELIRALAWQARQAPRFGHVAHQLGYLTPELLAAALTRRRAREKVGEAALRLGFITCLQQGVVLQAQRRGRRRLGDYFVQSGLVGGQDLDSLDRGVRAHNARVTFGRD
jgi:hypothetical protein